MKRVTTGYVSVGSSRPLERSPPSTSSHRRTAALMLLIMFTCSNAVPQVLDLQLPEMGNPSRAVISEGKEFEIGQNFFRKLRAAGLVETDPVIAGYIENLGIRLASSAHADPRNFTFFVVKDNNVNAFAAPGGFIGVNTGLIRLMESEAELAAVIAHEIAHVTQRHLVRHFEATSSLSLGMAAAVLAALLLGGHNSEAREALVFGSLGAGARADVNFTRAHEQEADRLGIQFLQNAGYPGQAMANTFKRLDQLSRFGGDGIPEFLRSHPVNESRIAEAQNRANFQTGTSIDKVPSDTPFALIQALLVARDIEAPAKAIQQRQRAIERGSYIDPHAARLSLALAYEKAERYADMQQILERLLIDDNDRPIYYLALTRALNGLQQHETAADRLRQANEIFPGDLALGLALADQLRRSGDLNASYRAYRTLALDHPQNPNIRNALATVAFDTGNRAEAYLERGEAFLLLGQTDAAKEALDRALEFPDASNAVAERIAQKRHLLSQGLEAGSFTSDGTEK